jgi:hypothetical protein
VHPLPEGTFWYSPGDLIAYLEREREDTRRRLAELSPVPEAESTSAAAPGREVAAALEGRKEDGA